MKKTKIFGIFAVALFAIMMIAPMCIAETDPGQPEQPEDCEGGHWIKVVDLWQNMVIYKMKIMYDADGNPYEYYAYTIVRVAVRWHWEFIVDDPNGMSLKRYDEEAQMSLSTDY